VNTTGTTSANSTYRMMSPVVGLSPRASRISTKRPMVMLHTRATTHSIVTKTIALGWKNVTVSSSGPST
jgi:hypothetical protein